MVDFEGDLLFEQVRQHGRCRFGPKDDVVSEHAEVHGHGHGDVGVDEYDASDPTGGD